MAKQQSDSQRSQPSARRIVGFSLPPALAAEVKMEAARRGVSLRSLFAEMWALYQNNTKRSAQRGKD